MRRMMLCVTAALLVCVGGQIGGAKTATAAPGGTKLAFRTAPGAVSIPAGQTKQLGTVNVGPFERIRVVADERTGSGVGVTVRLTIMEGSELVAQLDTISLTAKSQVTRVYEVPGTKLSISAQAGPGKGSAAVDVLVYGWAE